MGLVSTVQQHESDLLLKREIKMETRKGDSRSTDHQDPGGEARMGQGYLVT